MIAGIHLLMLDRDGAQMHAGLDDPALEGRRAARLAIIEGEAADDAAVARRDRARPARAQAQRQHELAIAFPVRVAGDVGHLDRTLAIDRRAARADARPDRRAIDRVAIGAGQAGRCERPQPELIVDSDDRADHSWRQRLDPLAERRHDRRQFLAARDRFQGGVLQGLQTLDGIVTAHRDTRQDGRCHHAASA
jgi:hypothetical protein